MSGISSNSPESQEPPSWNLVVDSLKTALAAKETALAAKDSELRNVVAELRNVVAAKDSELKNVVAAKDSELEFISQQNLALEARVQQEKMERVKLESKSRAVLADRVVIELIVSLHALNITKEKGGQMSRTHAFNDFVDTHILKPAKGNKVPELRPCTKQLLASLHKVSGFQSITEMALAREIRNLFHDTSAEIHYPDMSEEIYIGSGNTLQKAAMAIFTCIGQTVGFFVEPVLLYQGAGATVCVVYKGFKLQEGLSATEGAAQG
jgi:hypothetical protein